jgi:hypothetical protein
MVKKVLLTIAVTLTLIVLFFGYGKEPQYYLFTVAQHRLGLSPFHDVAWKVSCIVAWALFILYKEAKDDDNGTGR